MAVQLFSKVLRVLLYFQLNVSNKGQVRPWLH